MDVIGETESICEECVSMAHFKSEAAFPISTEEGPDTEDAIPQHDSSLPQQLSPAQQWLWYAMQLNPNVPVFNEAEAVRLTGELNAVALESALNMIIDRHEALRSTIRIIEGVPHSVIHDSWPISFKKIDLSVLSPAERKTEVDRLLIEEPRVRYDLETSPGIRARCCV